MFAVAWTFATDPSFPWQKRHSFTDAGMGWTTANWPAACLLRSLAVYFATEAVTHAHRSARSLDPLLKPDFSHHLVTEIWHNCESATEATTLSNFGVRGL